MGELDPTSVRTASAEDAEAICAIYNAALAERSSTFETAPRSAADFIERITETRFPLLVGDTGQGVLGWAGLAPYSTRACYSGMGDQAAVLGQRSSQPDRAVGAEGAEPEDASCADRPRQQVKQLSLRW